MGQSPHLLPSQQSVYDCTNQIPIAIVGLAEGLAETEEDVDLGLEGVESFLEGSGVEEEGNDRLEEIIVGADGFIFQQDIDADVDDVEVDQFQ